jgi:hypothetical protein
MTGTAGPTFRLRSLKSAPPISHPPNSRDAPIILQLPAGGYTVQVSGAHETTGIVLVEAYDLD